MAKTPCAVFWDIQNISVPKGQSAASIVSLIRSSLINLYDLREIYFYCVCDVTKLPAHVGNPLTNQDVNIIQAYDYTKDSADIKILDLMRKFVQNQNQECAVILLSGDGDYAVTLKDLKKLYNITIFLIRLRHSFSIKLEAVANHTFILNNGSIQPVKSVGTPKCFVAFSRFPMTRPIHRVKSELNKMTQPLGSLCKSAIEHENEVIIGFPSLELALRAVARLNTARYHGTFLKAEIIDNPMTQITIKMKNACSMSTFKPKRDKSFRRVNLGRKRKLFSNKPTIGKLKEIQSEDFIPLVSSNVIPVSTVTSTSSNPPNPFSNKSNLQITSETNGSRWVSLYSQSTLIKSPILIDLTGGAFSTASAPKSKPSSSLPKEIIPVVDLTEES